jgi:hypothetical protein
VYETLPHGYRLARVIFSEILLLARGSQGVHALKLAVFTIAMSILYWGLAVWGWGGLAGFFSHPALIALLTILGFAMTGVALFSPGTLNPGERENRSNRWVIDNKDPSRDRMLVIGFRNWEGISNEISVFWHVWCDGVNRLRGNRDEFRSDDA